MKSHQLPKIIKRNKVVGRGGNRGKTSTRGHKGQKSRAGAKIRPAFRDVLKKISKLRGHGKNRARTVRRRQPFNVSINLTDLQSIDTKVISPKVICKKDYIASKKGRHMTVKVLGSGTIDKPVTVVGCLVSKTAKDKIEKAGGTVKV